MNTLNILQWNCRSYVTCSAILYQKVQQIRPLFVLLQETRCVPTIRGYVTFSDPAITNARKRIINVSSNPTPSAPGYAILLARSDIACKQIRLAGLTSKRHEVILVHALLPSGKPILVASVYYTPVNSSAFQPSFQWLTDVINRYPNVPIM